MARDQHVLASSGREGLMGNGDCSIEGCTWHLIKDLYPPSNKLCWWQAARSSGPAYPSPLLVAVAEGRGLLDITLTLVSFPHPAIVCVAIWCFHDALVSQGDCVWVQEPAATGQGQHLNRNHLGTSLQLLQHWASAADFGVSLCLVALFILNVFLICMEQSCFSKICVCG